MLEYYDRCGFGLLMYGFGSKRTLLEDFASTSLTEYAVVVINGYFQSINLKQVYVINVSLVCVFIFVVENANITNGTGRRFTQFNWYWHHVPTFAPHQVEAMFLPLILAQGGICQNVKTASLVLQSLTPNVFKVLAEHQLAHPDEEEGRLGSSVTAFVLAARFGYVFNALFNPQSPAAFDFINVAAATWNWMRLSARFWFCSPLHSN
ncbi:hypothetical protein ACH5RR_035025 [Cinchona calisaya]|uniref:Origin recognition complex subunit 2 n=1 Tax=Cinchona calisaya TaxID=153742 RepID=A0ABD2YCM5_9GENT